MSKTHLVLFAGIVLAFISCIALVTSSSGPVAQTSPSAAFVPAPDPTETEISSNVPVEAKPVMPRWSGLTVHPYELVKNPFKFKGQLVLLDLRSRPVLYDGSVVMYGGPIEPAFGSRYGFMALRLNRLLAEDEAVYDVMGEESRSSEGQILGQLLVILPSGLTELDLARLWIVEPQGTVKGTNSFGAPISVPLVRFWSYQNKYGTPVPADREPEIPQRSTAVVPAGDKIQTSTQSGGVIGSFQPSSQQ